jgi:hypothetical protein
MSSSFNNCLFLFSAVALLSGNAARAADSAGAAQDMHHDHAGHEAPADVHAGHDMDTTMDMTGVLGPYALAREASGTSWQPDTSTHAGLHYTVDDWTVMAHAAVNGVYDWQDGPRGDDKTFVSGMVMGSARRAFTDRDVLNIRIMLSPDPVIGKRGYPLLFASGETADGATGLVDRQHPHDLFMEVSASYSRRFSADTSAFIYVGLPGEPAFGPPAFMHRASIMDSPEAPISHHWLDSTHITFGVATGGIVYRNWKIEASRFTGREPDESRYDIDHARFDSTAARFSWNPTVHVALQASWAHLRSPELLHPTEDETRWSASAIYTAPLWDTGLWSATAAWGRKELDDGAALDAWVLEAALKPSALWTVFARAERVENAELQILHGAHGHADTVHKASLGLIKDFRVAARAVLGVGGLYAFNWTPRALNASYGGNPNGGMIFLRLKIE